MALNQTVCALQFFYTVTFGHAEIPEPIVYARSTGTLPVVLSADEVVRFLEAVPSLKTRAAATTAYAAGALYPRPDIPVKPRWVPNAGAAVTSPAIGGSCLGSLTAEISRAEMASVAHAAVSDIVPGRPRTNNESLARPISK